LQQDLDSWFLSDWIGYFFRIWIYQNYIMDRSFERACSLDFYRRFTSIPFVKPSG